MFVAMVVFNITLPLLEGAYGNRVESLKINTQKITLTTLKTKGDPDPSTYKNRYAVLAVGAYHGTQFYRWYLRAIQMLYWNLTDKYGFKDDNIYVLLTMVDEWEEPDIFDPNIVDYKSTESNLQMVLNKFKENGEKEMSENDLLFITVIDHGNSGGFELYSDWISASEFASYVDGIKGQLIIVLQPCGSGGLIDELSADHRIICTSVSANEGEGGWIETFIRGLSGKADTEPGIGNNDGKVSIEEAFHLAAQHVWEGSRVHSLLDDNGDGVGHWFKSKGYDPNDPNKDAYWAARTFLDEGAELTADAGGPYSGKVNKEIQFYGSASGGTPPYTYYWDFGDGSSSNEQNPKHKYTEVGDYIATLTVTDDDGDTATDQAQVTIAEKLPKVDCEGSIVHTDVKPGARITDSFYVKNIGDPGSQLDWEIDISSLPSWASDWEFNPASGYDLKPEDGMIEIKVSFTAQKEKQSFKTGTIKVCNIHDWSDYDTIPVEVTTPKNKRSVNMNGDRGVMIIIHYLSKLQQILNMKVIEALFA